MLLHAEKELKLTYILKGQEEDLGNYRLVRPSYPQAPGEITEQINPPKTHVQAHESQGDCDYPA